MTLNSEEDVKKALDIKSWKNLSKDKVMSFVAQMPKMDKEVALKAIEQFPHFKTLISETLDGLDKQHKRAHWYNWQSQSKVHDSYKFYSETLKQELERDDLTVEDRFHILDMMRKAVADEDAKDAQQKQYNLRVFATGAVTTVVAIGAAIVAIGGQVGITDRDKAAEDS